MKQEFFISKPTSFMYLVPDIKSEITDELLYGTTVTFEDESYGGLLFCKTEYGYSGYVDVSHISQKKSRGEKYVVTSPFCDFYSIPESRFAPILTLPRASIIEGKLLKLSDPRFIAIEHESITYYTCSKNIAKYADMQRFDDEDSKRSEIVKAAFSYLGTSYRWGGKSTFGIDCSGLCFMAYSLCGMALYRDAVPDRKYVKSIPFSSLKPADLIYYNGHVTMYTGNNEYIHSSASLGGVKTGSFDKKSKNYYPKLSSDIITCARSLAFC